MGHKFHIDGAVTLSTKAVFDGELVDSAQFTLLIKTPIGPDSEPSDTETVEGIDLVLSDDGTRWEYNYVPERAGTHYYRFVCLNPAAADEDNFKVESTQFA